MKKIETVAILGAGIMGAGIANAIFRQNKLQVKIYDVDANLLKTSYDMILKGARKSMDPSKIEMVTSLDELAAGADLIIEAIVENMDIKNQVFSKLNDLAADHTVFASNTSSLNISEMGKASKRADRFIGLHFFNPPVIMRLTEIIVPEGVKPDVVEATQEFITEIKKVGIKCKESPAFIVNRILIPIINEAFFLLEELAKDDLVEAANRVDSAIINQNILPMGPFELVDLTGIDTAAIVTEVIFKGFNETPRYRPAPLMKKLVDQKLLGKKSGAGIYQYESKVNDPDLNPCLDKNGKKIERLEKSDFDTLDITMVMINEAFRVMEEGIVEDYQDIETCMELGTRWEKGPFTLAKEIGLKRVVEALNKKFIGGDPRYEPSTLLTNLTPELERFFNNP